MSLDKMNLPQCEDGVAPPFDFTEQSIRRGFIRKVYSILMCQLLVTMGFIAVFLFHEPTKMWAYNNSWLLFVALGVTLFCIITMSCCENIRRTVPWNYIFLFTFTLAESFVLGVISSMYDVDVVLMAVGLTAVLCLALTLFAFQTKWDFTVLGGGLLCVTIVFLIFGLAAIFLPQDEILYLLYASFGAILFSLYLIVNTQLMMGGKHKYIVSPEEYTFAALTLYLDIAKIFLYILRIVSISRSMR